MFSNKDLIEQINEVTRINFEQAKDKHLWIVEQLNRKDEQLTERLFWFAGISIGIIPFIIDKARPQDCFSLVIFIFFIFLLICSLIFGIINFFTEKSFYVENNEKEIKRINNWSSILNKMRNEKTQLIEIFIDVEKAQSHDRELDLNNKLKSAEWPTQAQVVTVMLGFVIEIIYLLTTLN